MPEQNSYWHAQIHAIMPDLEIKKFILHREGLVNDVLIVNDEWVFRFTKTDWGRELMETEYQLMKLLQPQVSLSIPAPILCEDGVMVYPHLKGKTFQRKIWAGATPEMQQAIADQIGQFLSEIHGVKTEHLDWDVPLTLAPVSQETWLDMYTKMVEKVYPLLLSHQIDWAESLFNLALDTPGFFDFQPVLVHGDLVPYHLLFDENKQLLNAVIDFGVAGLGDPATDLGTLISSYGESLVNQVERTFPDLRTLIPRARFYAQAIELQCVLLGVESGEQYWFTAHLGGARDIGMV